MSSKSQRNKIFSINKSPVLAWIKNNKKLIYKLVGIFIVLALLIDLSPIGGNIRFYAKWIECGQRPLVTQSWNGVAWYEEDVIYQPILRGNKWFCTPLEAEQAGYSANENSYEFPHLDALKK